jgi:hypothetical protein
MKGHRRSKRPSCAPRIKHETLQAAREARSHLEEALGAQGYYILACPHCRAWHVIHSFNRGATDAQLSRASRR